MVAPGRPPPPPGAPRHPPPNPSSAVARRLSGGLYEGRGRSWGALLGLPARQLLHVLPGRCACAAAPGARPGACCVWGPPPTVALPELPGSEAAQGIPQSPGRRSRPGSPRDRVSVVLAESPGARSLPLRYGRFPPPPAPPAAWPSPCLSNVRPLRLTACGAQLLKP